MASADRVDPHALVWSADVTEATLASLVAAGQRFDVLAGIATRSENADTLSRLARHPVWTIRRVVAMNDSAPIDVLCTLLDDDILAVQRAALVNAALPENIRRAQVSMLAWQEFCGAEDDWCISLGDAIGGRGTGALLLVLRQERASRKGVDVLGMCDAAAAAICDPSRPRRP